MRGKRYTEEFKIEAVKKITDRGYDIARTTRHLRSCSIPQSRPEDLDLIKVGQPKIQSQFLGYSPYIDTLF